MDDLLHTSKSTKYMSTLDLQCGCYQVEVIEEVRDKTCFIIPFGIFCFKRMPFGLRNPPATFQRLINRFKSRVLKICIFAYFDDIIICLESLQKHLEDIDAMLQQLVMFELRPNSNKCRFCFSSVKFLGHILTPKAIIVDPSKIQAIVERNSLEM